MPRAHLSTQRAAVIAALAAISALGVAADAQSKPEPAGSRVATILADQPVSKHAINLFATPVALCRGAVVVVSVEEGELHSRWLRTVAQIGTRAGRGWQWQRTVIEARTLPDDYHTQPSVGVDPRGRIHVAYNMHNMPWQYVVSREPCNLQSFEFRGEPLTRAQLVTVLEHNRSPFPGIGSAPIPGNQITYPAFFNDRKNDLYVTYRYASRPARPWLERAFAAAIARLDTQRDEWAPIGGATLLDPNDAEPAPASGAQGRPFAREIGWTVYPPRLWFDADNTLHAAWTWREGQAGQDTAHASYAMRRSGTEDFINAAGQAYRMPIGVADQALLASRVLDKRVFANASVTHDQRGPLIVLQPVNGERVLMRFDSTSRAWTSQGPSPFGASSVLCDDDGTCWAYASGPRVLVRPAGASTWRLVHEGKGYCDPKPLHDAATGRRLLHVTRCDQQAISLLEIAADPAS